MNARFAGSRTLDERRRRWLATHEAENAAPPVSGRSAASKERESAPAELSLTHFPLRKVISPNPWKIAGVGVVIFALGAGLLMLGALFHSHAPILGPGWPRMMDANGGRLARLYQAGLLLFSGQCALLIWWARTQSLRDFEGTYRVWLWCGLCSLFAAGCIAGDWHWAWSDTICWHWSARFPQREVLCWMLPGLTVASVIWRKLRTDMRRCASSSLLLWLTAAAVMGACVFRLGIDRTGWPMPARQFAGASLRMLASTSLFVGFLAHLRFVIHVSAEPPIARPSMWAKLREAALWLWAKRPRFSLEFWRNWRQAAAEKWKAKAEAKAEAKAAKALQKKMSRETANAPAPAKPARNQKQASQKEPSKPQPQTAKENKPQPPAAKPEPPARPAETKAGRLPETPAKSTSAPPKQPTADTKPTKTPAEPPKVEEQSTKSSASTEPQLRLDDPLDSEMLKGLSKKERRRLRKQHRESQRTT